MEIARSQAAPKAHTPIRQAVRRRICGRLRVNIIANAFYVRGQSELELRAELDEPARNDRLWPGPRRAVRAVGAVESQHRVRVEHVIEVEQSLQPDGSQGEGLGCAYIELIRALRIQRPRFNHVDGHVGGRGQIPAERGPDLRVRSD